MHGISGPHRRLAIAALIKASAAQFVPARRKRKPNAETLPTEVNP
jgi:hypothetical protein